MKAILTLAALLAFVPAWAHAQEVDTTVSRGDLESQVQTVVEQSGIVPALEEIAETSVPELEAALGRLTTTLATVGTRMASDPEVRKSTLRGAEGMVRLAQVVVVEHSDVLLEALRSASEQLEKMNRVEQPQPAEPQPEQ